MSTTDYPSPAVWKEMSRMKKDEYLRLVPTDCKFVVNFCGKSREFNCHKWVLSLTSSFFKAMFEEGKFRENNVITLPRDNVEFTELEAFLEYIYYNNFQAHLYSMQSAIHIYDLADYYDVPKLRIICHKHITKCVENDNDRSFANFVRAFAHKEKIDFGNESAKTPVARKFNNTSFFNLDEYEIRKSTIFDHYIESYTFDAIIATSEIYDLSIELFYELVKKLLPEKPLTAAECFRMIEMYAKSNALTMDHPIWNTTQTVNQKAEIENEHGNVEVDPKTTDAKQIAISEPRMNLNNLFDLVQFCNMPPKDFVRGPAVSNIWNVSGEYKLKMLSFLVMKN